MDLAEMIVRQSQDMDKAEKRQHIVTINISIEYDNEIKSYTFYMIHSNKMITFEYNNVKFTSSKKSIATKRNIKTLLFQILRQYMIDVNKYEISDETEVSIEFIYKNKTIIKDSHTIDDIINKQDLSLSPSCDHNHNICMLSSFLFTYMDMFVNAELS